MGIGGRGGGGLLPESSFFFSGGGSLRTRLPLCGMPRAFRTRGCWGTLRCFGRRRMAMCRSASFSLVRAGAGLLF